MNASKPLYRPRNILLCFDAFGTLFHPKEPIPKQYGRIAAQYGIETTKNTDVRLEDTFKSAYKSEAKKHPNYGKAVGMDHEKWWANVISQTFQPFLNPTQSVPQPLIQDLITQFSTSAGYSLYPDVLPFFRMLREAKRQNLQISQSSQKPSSNTSHPSWPWPQTIVGIITNSDSRVPGILSSFGLTVSPRRASPCPTPSAPKASAGNMNEEDINFIALSYDVSVSKPSPEIFSAATSLAKQTLTESSPSSSSSSLSIESDFEKLYIGDSLEEDYFGAKKAGWNALLLDRREHDDNLKDAPILRYKMKGGEEGVSDEVDVIRDLGALSKWRAVNYLVR